MAHGMQRPTEDMVFTILARLPVKSVICLAVVCRVWCRVILYGRKFATSQLEASRQSQSQSHRRIVVSFSATSDDSDPQIQSFDHYLSSLAINGFVSGTHQPPPTILGSNYLYPTTKNGHDGHIRVCGYVSATDDYKLLIAHFLYDDFFVAAKVNIFFSLRSNSWKNIESPDHTDENNVRCYGRDSGGCRERELLHWIFNFGDNQAILCFDLASEEFQTLSLSDFLHGNKQSGQELSWGFYSRMPQCNAFSCHKQVG